MPPIEETIIIYQGSTFAMELTHRDEAGNPVPAATVAAVRMMGRERMNSAEPLFSLSLGQGITVTDGFITVRMEAAATAQLNPAQKSGVYDLEVDYADGDTGRLIQGRFILSPEVTR